jgi:hypothetical protein
MKTRSPSCLSHHLVDLTVQSGRMMRKSAIRSGGGQARSDEDALARFVWRTISST